jgi:lyso-ornithine lipid O-acyltransferase
MSDWQSGKMSVSPFGLGGVARIALRGAVLGAMTYTGLAVLLILRLIEAPLFAPRRPITPFVTQWVCRATFPILGMRRVVHGTPLQGPGAMVANHGSWLDIFALNAAARIYFVAKSEVHGWAGIGWLARATGTVFIARRGVEAKDHKDLLERRLQDGHQLLFFPEGTSTDARRILPFKSSLFAAFLHPDLAPTLRIQPVTVVYYPPAGIDPRFYGWWGDMGFAEHLLLVLAAARQGRVEMTYHDPVAVADFPDRKALARHCESVIRQTFDAALPPAP